MPMLSDNYVIQLTQLGPVASSVADSLSAEGQGKLEFSADTLDQMRAIPHNLNNWRCDLLGYEEAFDGLMQGRYYYRASGADDDGNSIIRPNVYAGYVWRKFTS